MIYAPVLIITLNRHKHLICAVESLKKNKWAKYTDVYIAVDYPPNEKYREGYNKICEYLDNQCFREFRSFTVIKRKENYGAKRNFVELRDYIATKYDRWISAEDDIEFSQTFIEYMDKCLEKYENDDRVLAVSGYSYPLSWKAKDGTNAFFQDGTYSAWGTGQWREKSNECRKLLEGTFLLDSFDSAINSGKLEKMIDGRKYEYIAYALAGVNGNLFSGTCDMTYGIYMALCDKVVIAPMISQTRNHGFDGSGLCCSKVTDRGGVQNSQNYDYDHQLISENCDFELCVDESEESRRYNHKLLDEFLYVPDYLKKVSRILMPVYKILGKKAYVSIRYVIILVKKFKRKNILLSFKRNGK